MCGLHLHEQYYSLLFRARLRLISGCMIFPLRSRHIGDLGLFSAFWSGWSISISFLNFTKLRVSCFIHFILRLQLQITNFKMSRTSMVNNRYSVIKIYIHINNHDNSLKWNEQHNFNNLFPKIYDKNFWKFIISVDSPIKLNTIF